MMQRLLQEFKYFGLSGVFTVVKNRLFSPYDTYLKNEIVPTLEQMNTQIATFTYQPIISIIMPVYRPKIEELAMCINSIINNSYKNIEICIVDDGSNEDVLDYYLQQIASKFPTIINYYRMSQNAGIAAASNIAINNSTGEYLALIDNDDLLPAHTFFEYVKALQAEHYDFIYSDEDMIDGNNKRFNPQFKPDWSPHTLLSRMYVNHLSMYKRDLVVAVGGFRSDFDGTQDYNLLLRTCDSFKKIYHIPKILYHWRTSENSIAKSIDNKLYIFERAVEAIKVYFAQHNLSAEVEPQDKLLMYNIAFPQQKIEAVTLFINYEGQLQNLLLLLKQAAKINGVKVIIINTTTEKLALEDNLLVIENDEDLSLQELIKNVQGSYICWLTSEIMEVQLAKLLQNFIAISNLPQTGVIGCTTINNQTSIIQSGHIITQNKAIKPVGYGQKTGESGYYGRNISLHNYSIVSQDCFFVKMSVLESLPKMIIPANVSRQSQIILMQLSVLQQGYYNVNLGSDFVKVERHPVAQLLLPPKEQSLIWQTWQEISQADPNYNINFSESSTKLFQLR